MFKQIFPYFIYSVVAALALPMIMTIPFLGIFVLLPFGHLIHFYESFFEGDFSSSGEHVEIGFAWIKLNTDEAWFFYGSFFFVTGLLITFLKLISLSVPALNKTRYFICLVLFFIIIVPIIITITTYVGHTNKKVVLEENEVVQESSAEDITLPQEFVDVDRQDYPIKNDVFVSSFPATSNIRTSGREYYAVKSRRISKTLSLVYVDDGLNSHAYSGVVLYDDINKKMIKVVNYPQLTIEKWIAPGVRVTIQKSESDNYDLIVLDDYVRQEREVLYKEIDPNVQLVKLCEMGCAGYLELMNKDQIHFGRYNQVIDASGENYIEDVAINIPQKYLSKVSI